MENALSVTVNILYWEVRPSRRRIRTSTRHLLPPVHAQAGSHHQDCIQLACATFPSFALSECAANVQTILGVYGDAETLIETFDPAHAKWVTHAAWLPRDLTGCPYVLCRERYSWGLGSTLPDDMDAEVDALLERVKQTRKRLRSMDAHASPGPSKRQKRVTATASTSSTLLIQN